MKYDNLIKKIESNRGLVSFSEFGEGVSIEWIEKAEKRLNVQFPDSYKWWLNNYSGGEISNNEIFSIYCEEFDNVVGGDIVYINELYRRQSIFSELELVIQINDFGEIYYFDLTKRTSENENPVYVKLSESHFFAKDFLDFLSLKIDECLEH
jgi:hypothetical protein